MSELLAVIYSTKYIFTDGITVHNAKIEGNMAIVKEQGCCPMYLHGEGKEWHRTKEASIGRAEELRTKKLKAIDKQRSKIAGMIFDC